MDDEKNCFHRATPKFHINYDELTSTSLLLSDTNTQNSTFLEKNQISNFFNLFLFRCTFTKWNLWINTQIPIFNYFSSVFLFMMIRIIPISYPCLSKHMLTKLYIIVWSNKKHTKICIGIFTSSFMIKVIFVFFYKK